MRKEKYTYHKIIVLFSTLICLRISATFFLFSLPFFTCYLLDRETTYHEKEKELKMLFINYSFFLFFFFFILSLQIISVCHHILFLFSLCNFFYTWDKTGQRSRRTRTRLKYWEKSNIIILFFLLAQINLTKNQPSQNKQKGNRDGKYTSHKLSNS